MKFELGTFIFQVLAIVILAVMVVGIVLLGRLLFQQFKK